MVPTTAPSLLDAKPVSPTSPAFWTCGDCGRTTASQWDAENNCKQLTDFIFCECGRAAAEFNPMNEQCCTSLHVENVSEALVQEPDLETFLLKAVSKALAAWAKFKAIKEAAASSPVTQVPRAWHQISESEPLEETS